MSRLPNPLNILSSPDSSGDFGRDEGMTGYRLLTGKDIDYKSIGATAEMGVRLAMITTGRFDVNVSRATGEIVRELTKNLPPDPEGTC